MKRAAPAGRRLWALVLAGVAACTALPMRAGNDDPHAQAAMVRLRVVAGDAGYEAWADNLLAGPIEVRLDAGRGPRPPAEPALPARAGVPAGASVLVSRLHPPPGDSGWMRLRLTAVPGSSNARPRDVMYLPPLANPRPRIDQGFDGAFSHSDDENRYALDFATPIGTPVLAARGGTVMQVESGYRGSGLDPARDATRANFIRILHDDGSMALYGHLAPGGASVHPGQRVEAGQRIGLSGDTGYSTAPHLHFAVQVNRGGRLESIPFRMQGFNGR